MSIQNSPSVSTSCNIETINYMKNLDFTDSNDHLFQNILRNSSKDCIKSILIEIGSKMTDELKYTFRNNYISSLSEFYYVWDDSSKAELRKIYLRITPNSDNAKYYFIGLNQLKIDIRTELNGKIKEDWIVQDYGHRDSLTWGYYKYLVELGDVEALNKLGQQLFKLRSNPKSNAETRFHELIELFKLRSHSNLKIVDKLYEILNLFEDDKGTITHPGGDPMPGSESAIELDRKTPIWIDLKTDLSIDYVSNLDFNNTKLFPESIKQVLVLNSGRLDQLEILNQIEAEASMESMIEALPLIGLNIDKKTSKPAQEKFILLLDKVGPKLPNRSKILVKYALIRIRPKNKLPDYLK